MCASSLFYSEKIKVVNHRACYSVEFDVLELMSIIWQFPVEVGETHGSKCKMMPLCIIPLLFCIVYIITSSFRAALLFSTCRYCLYKYYACLIISLAPLDESNHFILKWYLVGSRAGGPNILMYH